MMDDVTPAAAAAGLGHAPPPAHSDPGARGGGRVSVRCCACGWRGADWMRACWHLNHHAPLPPTPHPYSLPVRGREADCGSEQGWGCRAHGGAGGHVAAGVCVWGGGGGGGWGRGGGGGRQPTPSRAQVHPNTDCTHTPSLAPPPTHAPTHRSTPTPTACTPSLAPPPTPPHPPTHPPTHPQIHPDADACLRVELKCGENAGYQFKTHPNIDKAAYSGGEGGCACCVCVFGGGGGGGVCCASCPPLTLPQPPPSHNPSPTHRERACAERPGAPLPHRRALGGAQVALHHKGRVARAAHHQLLALGVG